MEGHDRMAHASTIYVARKALRRVALVASGFGLVALLAACGGEFDRGPRGAGLPYDARLSMGETWRDFTVLVRAPGVDLAEARESARFVATRHCIERAASSAGRTAAAGGHPPPAPAASRKKILRIDGIAGFGRCMGELPCRSHGK